MGLLNIFKKKKEKSTGTPTPQAIDINVTQPSTSTIESPTYLEGFTTVNQVMIKNGLAS